MYMMAEALVCTAVSLFNASPLPRGNLFGHVFNLGRHPAWTVPASGNLCPSNPPPHTGGLSPRVMAVFRPMSSQAKVTAD